MWIISTIQLIFTICLWLTHRSYDIIPYKYKYVLVYLHADSILIGRAKLTRVSDDELNACRVILGRVDGPNILDDEWSGFTKGSE